MGVGLINRWVALDELGDELLEKKEKLMSGILGKAPIGKDGCSFWDAVDQSISFGELRDLAMFCHDTDVILGGRKSEVPLIIDAALPFCDDAMSEDALRMLMEFEGIGPVRREAKRSCEAEHMLG